MKLGLISDIHANLPALEAVFCDGADVERWLCLGDVVGYYPDANQVCELLRRHNILTLRGNHDAYVLGLIQPPPDREQQYRTIWTREELGADNMAWLAQLPTALRIVCTEVPVVAFHASPWDEETYIYPDSELAIARLEPPEGGWLALGHTHHPMVRFAGMGQVINPGSVGQPRNWQPGACYAVIDTLANSAELRCAAYDVYAYQTYLRTLAWPEPNINILSRRKETP